MSTSRAPVAACGAAHGYASVETIEDAAVGGGRARRERERRCQTVAHVRAAAAARGTIGAMWNRVRRFAHHPGLNVVAGIVMVGTALIEVAGELLREFIGDVIGAEHGLLAFGLLHTLKALPELVDGVAKVEEHARRERE